MSEWVLPGALTRMGEVVPMAQPAADADTREVEVSFSSEAPYKRINWTTGAPYWEVLGHAAGEVDLERLNSGAAPLLKDHMPTLDAKIGSVLRAWVDGGKGRAVVRFAETPAGDDILARVRAGDVTCTSVGYRVMQYRETGAQDGVPVVRAVQWVPREISFVADPADDAVGYGRAGAREAAPISVQLLQKGDHMSDDTNTQTRAAETAPAQPIDAEAIRREAAREAMTRAAEFDAIAKRFDLPGEMVQTAMRNGETLDGFRKRALDHMASTEAAATRGSNSMIGLTETEVKRFSVMRLVRYMVDPSAQNSKAAGFEIEAARTAADKRSGARSGLSLPTDVLLDTQFATRAQNTGTASAGGALVPTQYLGGSYIDHLRDAMPLAGAGVTILPNLMGNVDIPKQNSDVTEYWLDEGEDVTDSEITVGLVSLTPKTVAFSTPITRRMLLQSDPAIEARVRASIIARAALAIERAALVGHPSGKGPVSLRSLLIASAASWATAGSPTLAEVVALKAAVKKANAATMSMRWIMNAETSGTLEVTPVDAGSGRFILEGDRLRGHGYTESNVVADYEMFFGAWEHMHIGMWSGLDLSVDTAALAASGGVKLRAFQDVDSAISRTAAFALATN